MSQASAQRIIQMYSNANTERINSALEIAFQEAQSLQLSEQATRKLLLDTISIEQKSFDAYVTQLQKARTARARNDNDLARESMRIAYKNIADNERVRDQNIAVEQKGIDAGDKLYNVDSGVVDDFAPVISKVGQKIQAGEPLAIIMSTLNRENFDAKLATAKVKLGNRKFVDMDGQLTQDYLMSDTVEQILFGIAQQAGVDVSDPKIQAVAAYITNANVAGSQGRSGAWQGLKYQDRTQREDAHIAYKDAYLDKYGKGTKGSTTKKFGGVTRQEQSVIRAAQPVLRQLSASDDSPFQLTDQERNELGTGAIGAYEQLKEIYRAKPTVVTLDDAVLLDDIALQRALRVETLKGQAAQPMMKPRSTEATMARASEIAEPRRAEQGREDMAQRPAFEQKYFASERKSLELSDQDDQTVRAMGTPETYGITKWKEVWNGEQMSSDYGSIVSDIEQQFPNPTDQLKALSAFNSRAMSLQRAKSPILVEGGKLSDDYKAALEAMTPKEL